MMLLSKTYIYDARRSFPAMRAAWIEVGETLLRNVPIEAAIFVEQGTPDMDEEISKSKPCWMDEREWRRRK